MPVTGVGGLAAAGATVDATAVVVHPKGEAAIDALFDGLAAQRREFESCKSEHAEDHARELWNAEAVGQRSAVIGMAGFLLVALATVVWNLPRTC